MFSFIWQIPLMVAVQGLHLVGSLTGPCTMIQLSGPEGASVTLTMEYKSNTIAATDIYVVEWWKNVDNTIIRYFPGNKLVVLPDYKDKVKFNNKAFSMELMNLQKNDSGVYRADVIYYANGTVCAARYNLSVIEPVAVPTIVSNQSISNFSNETMGNKEEDWTLTVSWILGLISAGFYIAFVVMNAYFQEKKECQKEEEGIKKWDERLWRYYGGIPNSNEAE